MKTTIKTTKKLKIEIGGKPRTINYSGNKIISVTAEGKDIRISKNKYKILFEEQNVKFRIPEQSITSMVVDEQINFSVEEGNLIEKSVPAYFRAGIILRDQGGETILSRNFFPLSDNETPYNLPFGKTVLGAVQIQECIMHNNKRKIIVNYTVERVYNHQKDGDKKLREIKITPSPSGKNKFIKKINPTNYFIIIK